jgi:hypothetical protein
MATNLDRQVIGASILVGQRFEDPLAGAARPAKSLSKLAMRDIDVADRSRLGGQDSERGLFRLR